MEDRREQVRRMHEGKKAKAAARGNEPRLPDTRVSEITNAPPPLVYGAGSTPSVVEVLGSPIAKLARDMVKSQPDAAGLDYQEREYRESIERQKLRIEYYELSGQFDKATLWDAQLRKSLERHTREQRRAVGRKTREKLESEYIVLSVQLNAVREKEAARMTDEELRAAVEKSQADDNHGSAGDDAWVAAMTDADLMAEIARMKSELARHAAGTYTSRDETPAVEQLYVAKSDCESDGDDTSDLLPASKVGSDEYEPVIEVEATQATATDHEVGSEPDIAIPTNPATARDSELTKSTPGRRDPFY